MAAKAKTTTRTRGATVALPTTVESEEASWPGGSRGAGSRNAALREQLTGDVEGMEFGSVRRYRVTGDAQKPFLNLFRSVVANVWEGAYGVRASIQADSVVVKLDNPITRTRTS